MRCGRELTAPVAQLITKTDNNKLYWNQNIELFPFVYLPELTVHGSRPTWIFTGSDLILFGAAMYAHAQNEILFLIKGHIFKCGTSTRIFYCQSTLLPPWRLLQIPLVHFMFAKWQRVPLCDCTWFRIVLPRTKFSFYDLMRSCVLATAERPNKFTRGWKCAVRAMRYTAHKIFTWTFFCTMPRSHFVLPLRHMTFKEQNKITWKWKETTGRGTSYEIRGMVRMRKPNVACCYHMCFICETFQFKCIVWK